MASVCTFLRLRKLEDEPGTHMHRNVLSCGVHALSWSGYHMSDVEGFTAANCN